MALTIENKRAIMAQYQRTQNDTGSSEVQIALLTHDINGLQEHFRINQKDHHSRRGLIRKVNRRRKLLDYLKSRNLQSYQVLIQSLGLRR